MMIIGPDTQIQPSKIAGYRAKSNLAGYPVSDYPAKSLSGTTL